MDNKKLEPETQKINMRTEIILHRVGKIIYSCNHGKYFRVFLKIGKFSVKQKYYQPLKNTATSTKVS